jgi:predicted  nucleic acid-binding Zn-ribbon protein
MENSLSRAQSRVASQQKLVEEIDANYTLAVDNYNKRGQEFDARTQEYKAKKAALLEDKIQIEQDKENYLANVKNSPEYLRLSDEWKSLQLQAREFGS